MYWLPIKMYFVWYDDSFRNKPEEVEVDKELDSTDEPPTVDESFLKCFSLLASEVSHFRTEYDLRMTRRKWHVRHSILCMGLTWFVFTSRAAAWSNNGPRPCSCSWGDLLLLFFPFDHFLKSLIFLNSFWKFWKKVWNFFDIFKIFLLLVDIISSFDFF